MYALRWCVDLQTMSTTLRIAVNNGLTILNPGISRRPPRKQAIWAQCYEYIQNPIFFLLQLDNLNDAALIQFKAQLRTAGVALKTPKTKIMAKVLRNTPYSCLADAATGFMGIAITKRPHNELRTALQVLRAHPNITLLGGKIHTQPFTVEGMSDIIQNVADRHMLQAELVASIEQVAQSLTLELQRASTSLTALLTRHISHNQDK